MIDPTMAQMVAKYYHDPLGYVLFAFDWGRDELEAHLPDVWQIDILREIEQWSKGGGTAPLRIAVSSGHGIGKGALTAWLILWFMSTRIKARGVVTANTKIQLTGKTWSELALWHNRAINKEWFVWTKTRFEWKASPATWFFEAVPWSKEKPEAFAGLHAENVMILFDEASGIDDAIWPVVEGALTTSGIFAAFGNPTRNDGAFARCFTKMQHRWTTRQVDSRNARMANKALIAEWREDYGEESDFFLVRVCGKFPKHGTSELIPEALITPCLTYVAQGNEAAPVVLGVDVARFGEDSSVIVRRQGRVLFKDIKMMQGLNTTLVANAVAEQIVLHRPQAVFVDEIGIGAGVVDQLRNLGFTMIIGVQAAAKALDDAKFLNARIEMWWKMRDWIKAGASLPNNLQLIEELQTPHYGYVKSRIMLESKNDIKARLKRSPDIADSVAMTFARVVVPVDLVRKGWRKQATSGEWRF